MSACCEVSHTTAAAEPGDADLARTAREWLRLGIAGLVAGQAMIFSLAVNVSPPSGTARTVIHACLAVSAVVVFLLAGLPILRESWQALREGRVVFEQLFLIGIAGAFGASVHSSLTGEGHVFYEVVSVLVAIYTLGTLLARRRRDAVRVALTRLGGAFDRCERVTCCGGVETVPVSEIQPGDIVIVAPAAGIPVDGVVAEGMALVSEAALTGEPHPVVKRAGDTVLAGSFVEDSALRVRAASRGRSRRLDTLLRSVEEARGRPCRVQREADRLVAWFLPAVMVVATLTTAAWTLHAGWIAGLFNGLAVLLVACPCSMGLATPLAIWSALGALARRGIIARGGDAIEDLARVDTVVFDKTGTLSEESARLVDFVAAPGVDRAALRRRIASVQFGAGHPIARAFGNGEAAPELARDVRILPGTGIEGTLPDGTRLQVGNTHLLHGDDAGDVGLLRRELGAVAAGTHEIFVRENERLVAMALLRETMRESAPPALRQLDTMGIATVVMTGDRGEHAARFGFRRCLAGLSPDGKLDEVRRLKDGGAVTLFVGDGINDAPAMAGADVSMAMAGGSELPRATAAMELHGCDLRSVPAAIAISRAATRAIRRNLSFAVCYNIAGIALAAAGMLDPIVAALLMLVSSMTVTWRVLRQTQGDALERTARPARRAPAVGRPRAAQVLREGIARLERRERPIFGAALALQGPVLAWLGDFHGWYAAGFVALFAAAGAVIAFAAPQRPFTPPARMTAAMLSVGGLAMLAGWWGDAGFAPVIRDGVCLCGCPDSTLGLGLVGRVGWMSAGMVLAAVPGLLVERTAAAFPARLWCWGAGLVGMFAGMELAALVLSGFPIRAAGFHFFLTYAAMVTGMCGGMLAGCGAMQRVVRPFEPVAS